MAEFEIKITELEGGSREYDFPIRAAWLCEQIPELAPEDHALADTDGSLHVVAEKSGGDVLVRGEARAAIFVPCGRCLSPARVVCDTSIAVLLTRRSGEAPRPVVEGDEEDDDFSPDDPDHETFSGDEVRLDDLVREHLVLEIPMQPLCRPDCPGIEVPESIRGPKHLDAPVGAPPDIDPRLAPLLALSKGKKASS